MHRVATSLHPAHQPRMPWTRVNSLVDGIFGFSATVLMIRLGAPVYEQGELAAALVDQAPYYLLYALGFFQILSGWSVMRRVSSWTTGLDFYAMLLAFVALMMWATAPFTIDVMVGAIDDSDDFAASVRLMAITLMVPSAALGLLVRRLNRLGFSRPGLDREVFDLACLACYTAVAWPAAAFALSFASGWLGLVPIILVVLFGLAPLDAMSTEQYDELG